MRYYWRDTVRFIFFLSPCHKWRIGFSRRFAAHLSARTPRGKSGTGDPAAAGPGEQLPLEAPVTIPDPGGPAPGMPRLWREGPGCRPRGAGSVQPDPPRLTFVAAGSAGGCGGASLPCPALRCARLCLPAAA